MAELIATTGVIKYKPEKRMVKLLIDSPEHKNYKVRFEKEDKTDKKRVGILCNGHKYKKDYTFNCKEPYILNIDSSFKGNIIVELENEKMIKYPVWENSKEAITFTAIKPPKKKKKPRVDRISAITNQYHNNMNKYLDNQSNDDLYALIEIGDKYLSKLSDGTHKVTEDMKDYFIGEEGLVNNSAFLAGALGLPGDILQTVKDSVKNFKVSFFKGIIGFSFKIVEKEGKRFIVLLGWNTLLKAFGTAFISQGAGSLVAKEATKVTGLLSKIKFWTGGIWVTAIIGSAIGFWQEEDKSNISNTIASILSNVLKASISLGVGELAMLIGTFFVGVSGGWVVVAGIGLAIIVSFTLNYIDSKDGITNNLKIFFDELEKSFSNKINQINDNLNESIWNVFKTMELGLGQHYMDITGDSPDEWLGGSKYGNW